jgi:hypothetical protein
VPAETNRSQLASIPAFFSDVARPANPPASVQDGRIAASDGVAGSMSARSPFRECTTHTTDAHGQ